MLGTFANCFLLPFQFTFNRINAFNVVLFMFEFFVLLWILHEDWGYLFFSLENWRLTFTKKKQFPVGYEIPLCITLWDLFIYKRTIFLVVIFINNVLISYAKIQILMIDRFEIGHKIVWNIFLELKTVLKIPSLSWS